MMFLDSATPPKDYVDNPHAHLARWHAAAPLQYLEKPGLWLATSYDGVTRLLRDERLVLTAGGTFTERSREFRLTVVRQLRAYFGSPDAPFIDAAVHDVVKNTLDRVVSAGEAELIGALAQAIPRGVMGRLLGIPEAELHQVWSLTPALLSNYEMQGRAAASGMAKGMLDAYFIRHLARARARETSPLMTLLLKAQREHGIADEVLADVCSRLLAAGSSTTAGGFGNILLRLLQAPGAFPENLSPRQRQVLGEELLRLETPLLGIKRQAEEDVELPGATIRKGEKVLLMVAAANRDPAHFPEPDAIDLERTKPKHLSFGMGAFHCLGAPLARKELAILLEQLLPLLPAIEVLRPPTRKVGWLLYEPAELHVRIGAVRHVE